MDDNRLGGRLCHNLQQAVEVAVFRREARQPSLNLNGSLRKLG